MAMTLRLPDASNRLPKADRRSPRSASHLARCGRRPANRLGLA